MTFRRLFSRNTVSNISRIGGRGLSSQSYSSYRCIATISTLISRSSLIDGRKSTSFYKPLCRYVHTSEESGDLDDSDSVAEPEEDESMNEFLSRFVWIMRKKLSEAYPECDKNMIDGMLVIIVGKVVSEMEKGGLEQMIGGAASTPSDDFSEDLWKTVWEVSNQVLSDMEKEKKKEKMKSFLQDEEVKQMYRFAGEVGVRGDLLRELRFKWARERMEESEFYQYIESLKKAEAARKKSREDEKSGIEMADEGEEKVVSLPKRHGKFKYKVYGLDLSDPKWADVADKIHESGEILWPKEAKPISGKSKHVTDKLLALQEGDDPAPLLGEWISLLEPTRVDWIALLDRLKEQNSPLYLKVAELLLSEESFQANIRDYSKLIDALAKSKRFGDAERLLKKMNEKGILEDVITLTTKVHMYSESGNLEKTEAAFNSLKSHGFQPDKKVYTSMIMAYVKAGKPLEGEGLMRQMENSIKPTREIYTALLRSFANLGHVPAADRISSGMHFAGFQPNLETCTLMIEACGRARKVDEARSHFDNLKKLGLKPDDKCTSIMIAAYENENLLDKALNLLLELEKDGIEAGVATYTVLIDWLGKLELLDEAEQLLEKIAEQGEAPPFQIHISLCDMYSRAGSEKKALQALGVLESKIDQMGQEEFDRIIGALTSGGFVQDALRLQGLMEARGFKLSDQNKIALMAAQAIRKGNKSDKGWLGSDKNIKLDHLLPKRRNL